MNMFNVFRLAVNLERFVASFIDFPKLIFAVVNGPAVGIMVMIFVPIVPKS